MGIIICEDPCPTQGQSMQDLIDAIQNDEDYESNHE